MSTRDIDLPKALADRIEGLRGRLHPFDALDAARTALVVVDLQNVFMAEGAAYEVPAARDIVTNINRLADTTRRVGGTVVWVQMTFDPADPWRTFYDHMLAPARAAALKAGLTPGDNGHALWPGLDVRDGDMRVLKTRFSAFLPTSSDIAERLRARGIDTVMIAGTLTNTCCESSARDAMMMDFRTVMVADANAAALDDLHEAVLRNFIQVLGDVRTTEDAIALLEAGADCNSAAAQ